MDFALHTVLIETLERTALFGTLDSATRVALLPYLEPCSLHGGDTLFARGASADAVYVLRSGSLGVFGMAQSDGRERLLGVIAPGETVGELGLLTDQARAYAVRALRDCTLLRLPRASFERLQDSHPRALLAASRRVLERLLANDMGDPLARSRGFALLPFDDAVDARSVAEDLARALRLHGVTLVIDAATGCNRDADWFSAREREHEFLLYVADGGDPAWRATCIRQCDQLLLAASTASTPAAWPDAGCHSGDDALHRPRHLLLLGAGGTPAHGRATRWLAQFHEAPQWHHLRGASDCARLARLLTRRAQGVVLSGGGARGFAHIGVIRALRALGRPIDSIGGTSIGAIVAAGVACEWDDAELLAQMRKAFVDGHPLRDMTVPLIALTRGARSTRLLRAAFGNRAIEDLALPYYCVSSNLSRGSADVHTRGPLWLWLRASAAIPGVLPPLLHRGMVHVDGAVMNNLPVDVMRDRDIDTVVAVDISGDDTLSAGFDAIALPRLPRLTWRWLRGHRWPSLFAILVRAAMVQSETASAQRRSLATHLLTPPHADIGLLDWRGFTRAVEAGYRYTMEYFDTNR